MIRRLAAMVMIAGSAGAAEIDHAAIAERAVAAHILPAYDRLSIAVDALVDAARTCDADAMRAAYHGAFDAWIGAAHLTFGPAEAEGRMFAIAFWPDPKGFTAKQLRRLIRSEDDVVDDPVRFAGRSIAARGLFAIERLFFDPEFNHGGDYRCRLSTAIAVDMATTVKAIRAGWDQHAAALRRAGAPGADLYHDADDGSRALFNALTGGLRTIADLRLGRPLGSIRRPHPRRAEAWRSDRPLRNVALALTAAENLFETAFAPSLTKADAMEARAALRYAAEAAATAPRPLMEAVTRPGERLKIDALRGAVEAAREALLISVGGGLALAPGFNALDGD